MRQKIIELLKKIVPAGVEVEVVTPENYKLGHYSTAVAFRLAKIRKIAPAKVAEEIKNKLEKTAGELFTKIEVVPPGFINFFLNQDYLNAELFRILKAGRQYGNGRRQKMKVQVEFISANPTGPLTLANGRGGFLGDVLANVLERSGLAVEREYYVNDTGNQIVTLGKSLLAAVGLIPDAENFYKGNYVKNWAKKHKKIVQKNSANPLKIGQLAAKDLFKEIKTTLKKSGIIFDRFTSEENHIHKKGLVSEALKIFKIKKLSYAKDGAVWLKTTAFGDDKDRVIITKDAFPTYFLADSGHYLETRKRGFDRKINILGPDHYGYVGRIQAAAQILGVKSSKIIVTQAMRVMAGGKAVKMSKRAGRFVDFDELLKAVGLDVARFMLLMVAPESHLDFDLTLAKERSMKNPVYYVQYAYVRAINIVKKVKATRKEVNLHFLDSGADLALIRKLVQFPEIVEDTADDYQVHRLTRYATELARLFHNFYEKERVAGAEPEVTAARLALVRATAIVLENLFNLLGISAPKKM